MNHATNESGEDIVDERRKLCLENGSGEFWVVDEDYREVQVWTPNGRTVTYRSDDEVDRS